LTVRPPKPGHHSTRPTSVWLFSLVCSAAWACGSADTGGAEATTKDSGGLPTPDGPAADEGCESLTLGHDGPDSPVVGDQWAVFLRCDEATLVGASVLTVDPVEAAEIDENLVIFREAGPCTVRLQVGSRAASLDVVVNP
jgi:hypothetical protein